MKRNQTCTARDEARLIYGLWLLIHLALMGLKPDVHLHNGINQVRSVCGLVSLCKMSHYSVCGVSYGWTHPGDKTPNV
jgi:hypothetical protein